jgi:hypothetical protein
MSETTIIKYTKPEETNIIIHDITVAGKRMMPQAGWKALKSSPRIELLRTSLKIETQTMGGILESLGM